MYMCFLCYSPLGLGTVIEERIKEIRRKIKEGVKETVKFLEGNIEFINLTFRLFVGAVFAWQDYGFNFKLFLSLSMITLFFSPLTYLFIISLAEFFLLPKVEVKSYLDWKEYERFLNRTDDEKISPLRQLIMALCRQLGIERENRGRTSQPFIMVLYPKVKGFVEDSVSAVKRLAVYGFLLQHDYYRDSLNYRNLLFVFSCFSIFSLLCLADQYLLEKVGFSIGGITLSSSFWKGVHLVLFFIWLFFLAKLLLLFFPENLSISIWNSLFDRSIVDHFSFFYRIGNAGWNEFWPGCQFEFKEERKFLREFIIIVLIGFVLQFLLINSLWNYN
jgi:hypothetical protein